MATIMADGNFKAENLEMKHPEDDVSLSDGKGFMVTSGPYKTHLASTPDPPVSKSTRSTCHEHRAVNQVNTTRGNLVSTGIGATACGRHGCFFPHSVVDFQKGERCVVIFLCDELRADSVRRQKNMDYAFAHAIGRFKGLLRLLMLLYDINCQYHKYLFERLRQSAELHEMANLDDPNVLVYFAIGLFHVHGHQNTCYCRFAPTFITGAGMIDGELIETLWDALNQISGSIRAMSYFHRQETIDLHMNDSNWKKLTRMGKCLDVPRCNRVFPHRGSVPALLRKFKNAVPSSAEATEEFEKISELPLVKANQEAWLQKEAEAQRARKEDLEQLSKLDMYDVKPGTGQLSVLHSNTHH